MEGVRLRQAVERRAVDDRVGRVDAAVFAIDPLVRRAAPDATLVDVDEPCRRVDLVSLHPPAQRVD
jgi:hypothetical protein